MNKFHETMIKNGLLISYDGWRERKNGKNYTLPCDYYNNNWMWHSLTQQNG